MLGVGWDGPLGPRRVAELPAAFGIAGVAEASALAVIMSVVGIGPATLERLVGRLGSAMEVLRVAGSRDAVRELVEAAAEPAGERPSLLTPATASELVRAAATAESFLRNLERAGIRPIAVAESAYPARLRAIELPPPVLFVAGDPAALSREHAVAVVGTRRPTDAGRRTAARIAGALARADATVVSGLATGIDGSAHAGTIEEGGVTVAVIGSGHARLFPRVHERLAAAIVDAGGAVVSEHAPDMQPTRGTFPRRNRIISGLAEAVVIVEAGARSGALLTGSWALEQGKEVFVVPGSIDAPTAAGCNGFLRDWPGLTRIVSGVPQLLEDLGLAAEAALLPTTPGRSRGRPGGRNSVADASASATLLLLDPLDRLVAAAILAGAATVDELVAIASATVPAVLGALTRLETAGLVVGSQGRYRPGEALQASGRRVRRSAVAASPAPVLDLSAP